MLESPKRRKEQTMDEALDAARDLVKVKLNKGKNQISKPIIEANEHGTLTLNLGKRMIRKIAEGSVSGSITPKKESNAISNLLPEGHTMEDVSVLPARIYCIKHNRPASECILGSKPVVVMDEATVLVDNKKWNSEQARRLELLRLVAEFSRGKRSNPHFAQFVKADISKDDLVQIYKPLDIKIMQVVNGQAGGHLISGLTEKDSGWLVY